MTAAKLFDRLAPLVAPMIEREWGRRDLCILATRITLDVAAYFDVAAQAKPVKAVAYNAAFASHVEHSWAEVGFDAKELEKLDGSWAVGIGLSLSAEPGRFNGHLIAVADGEFADFAINQAERPKRGIVTGTAILGPYAPPSWRCIHAPTGTVVEYHRFDDESWRRAPDWRDRARRKRIVGSLIREVRS